MAEYACPSCGAPMTFRSSFSVYAVCSFCGSTVLRTDRDVSLIGTMADLPDEMTPFQVGTGLSWHTDTYTLAGRVRMGWADGAWNEWFIDSANRKGWLSEAQGFLALAFETPVPRRLDRPGRAGRRDRDRRGQVPRQRHQAGRLHRQRRRAALPRPARLAPPPTTT